MRKTTPRRAHPSTHYTVNEAGQWIVIHQGQPLCAPTTEAAAQAICKRYGFPLGIPVYDAVLGQFRPLVD